jgi:hypothetical protein
VSADTLQTLAVGAMGGVSTYFLARRQFVSERVWEKKYEVYSDVFSLLNSIEHRLNSRPLGPRRDRANRREGSRRSDGL